MVLTRFWAICGRKLAILKALLAFRKPKMAQHGLKKGLIPLVCAPQIVQKYLLKNTFLLNV